jgi:uncharacterized protein YoxC
MYQKPVTLAEVIAAADDVSHIVHGAEKAVQHLGQNIANETLPAADSQYAFRRLRQATLEMVTPKLDHLQHVIQEWGRS